MLIIRNSKIPGLIKWLDVAAITIGPLIFVAPGHANERVMHHEAIHVRQGKELLYLGFWLLYLFYFLQGYLSGLKVAEAYRAIPFEREARAHEADLYYLSLRPSFNWWHYRGDE